MTPSHDDKLYYVSNVQHAEAGKSMGPVFEAEVDRMERKFPSLANMSAEEFEALAAEVEYMTP